MQLCRLMFFRANQSVNKIQYVYTTELNNVEVTRSKKLSLSLLDANVNLYWYFVGSILDLEYQCNAAFTNVSDKLIYQPFPI